jgi:hypothetical protein
VPGSETVSTPLVPLVTAELLRRVGACREWRRRFAEVHPDGVVVTVERCLAEVDEWPWADAAAHLLTYAGKAEFCPNMVGQWALACTCWRRTRTESAQLFAELAIRHGLTDGAPAYHATAST